MLASGVMGSVWALGLGNLHVSSGLGQKFQAQLTLTGSDAAYLDAACYRARIENSEGVLVTPIVISVSDTQLGRQLLLNSRRDVNEPTIKLIVEVSCEVQLQRQYTVLLDPPVFAAFQANNSVPKAKGAAEVNAESKPVTANNSLKKVQLKATKHPDDVAVESGGPRLTTNQEKVPQKSEKGAKKINAVRDSLKLSDEVTLTPAGLKMSTELGPPSKLNSMQLKEEQARLAAYLRDEVAPVRPVERQIEPVPPKSSETEQLLKMRRDSEQLRKQNQQNQQALDELRENSVPRNWVLGLLGFILLGIGLVLALVFYIARLNKKIKSGWWEEKVAEPEIPEAKKDVAAIVDHVQASYNESNSLYKVAETNPKSVSLTSNSRISEAAKAEAVPQNSLFKKNPYLPSLEDSNSSTFNFFSNKTSSVKVEEISDVTQEAEFWMSVNDPQRAIEILEPQADLDVPDSPVPWLYLLDLYRIVADKAKYDPLRDRFIAYFNANIPEFEADLSSVSTRQLEDFPHLIEKICGLWNTKEALPFLEGLLVDDRDGKRMGFELPVYRDILLLISVAHELERTRVTDKQTNRIATPVEEHTPGIEKADDSLQFEMIEFEPLKQEKNL